MLGLICDPVAGLVEIPCVKRNAAGVAQCFIAVDLAMAGVESAIPADEVIDAMTSVGSRMDERFRETAQGGISRHTNGETPGSINNEQLAIAHFLLDFGKNVAKSHTLICQKSKFVA
ncbi:MAG: hypothetical protein B6243_12800 [Anaerolineaceae bacterium 4572_5.2]|nr:MAG: hypothetical protein B6243_12800 [Anaerolineaceae bacterium 4572_5.2]